MIRIILTICILCLPCLAYDMNLDGSCDMLDFAELAKGWGDTYDMDDLSRLASNFANPNYVQDEFDSVDWSLFSLSDKQFFSDNFLHMLFFSDYLGYENIQSFLLYMTDYTESSLLNENDFSWFDLNNFTDYDSLSAVVSGFDIYNYDVILSGVCLPVYCRCDFYYNPPSISYYDSLGFLTVGIFNGVRTIIFLPSVVDNLNMTVQYVYSSDIGFLYSLGTDYPVFYDDLNIRLNTSMSGYNYYSWSISSTSYSIVYFCPYPFVAGFSNTYYVSGGNNVPLYFHPKILTSYYVHLPEPAVYRWNFSDYQTYSDLYIDDISNASTYTDVIDFNFDWRLSSNFYPENLTPEDETFALPLGGFGHDFGDLSVSSDPIIPGFDFDNIRNIFRLIIKFFITLFFIQRVFYTLTEHKGDYDDDDIDEDD